jgi:hypothetical protein
MSVTTIKWVYNKTNELVLYQNHPAIRLDGSASA